MTDTNTRTKQTLKVAGPQNAYDKLDTEIAADSAAEQAPAKKPRKAAGPPSDKQLAARAQFKEKVVQAQALRKAEPGLKYNEAIKRVYGKTPQSQ